MAVFRDHLRNGSIRNITERRLLHQRTAKYEVTILDTKRFGRLLILNDEIQLSSADEDIYHRHLIGPALDMLAASDGATVRTLLLGGSDGFSLTKLLRSPRVSHVRLVDHDPELLDLFINGAAGQAFGTSSSFRDRRVLITSQDAAEFLEYAPDENWNLIVVDLTDDWIESAKLWVDLGQKAMNGALVSLNLGPTRAGVHEILKLVARANLACVRLWSLNIPSYGEDWLLGLCSTVGKHREPVFSESWDLHVVSP
jgi:predicted membrane-bound spermidine synthase